MNRHRSQNLGEAMDGAIPTLRDDGYQMFEYGCHEGNYAMTNSLNGARAGER